MTWYYNNIELDDDLISGHFGMVYLITNLQSGHRYIGKKLFTKAKTKMIKGKKKKSRIESDWKDYYGSNKKLLEDINIIGKENFKREILVLCKTRGECTYWEGYHQFINGVLINDGWYNDQIYLRVHRSHMSKKIKDKKNIDTICDFVIG